MCAAVLEKNIGLLLCKHRFRRKRQFLSLDLLKCLRRLLTLYFFATFIDISDYAILYLQPLWLVGTSGKNKMLFLLPPGGGLLLTSHSGQGY